MQVENPIVLDLLDVKAPALSSISDMPVIETKPDASPAKEPIKESAAPKEPAKEHEAKEPAESATAEQPEDDSPASDAPKKAKGVQKRIDELTRQAREAERLAEAERQEKLRLLALLEDKGKPKDKPAAQDDEAPKRPTKADFVDNQDGYEQAMDDYVAQRASYEATKAVKADRAEQESKAHQKAIEDGQKAVQTAYMGRVEKAKEKYADYEAVAESPEVTVSIPMAHAILHSEHGPDLAYFLGKNSEEAERISKLPPPAQLVEMGLIVASLRTPVAPKEPSKEVKEAAKPPVSNAPKPIKPLGAGSEAVAKSPEDESMEEYASRRKRELAAERRPGMRH